MSTPLQEASGLTITEFEHLVHAEVQLLAEKIQALEQDLNQASHQKAQWANLSNQPQLNDNTRSAYMRPQHDYWQNQEENLRSRLSNLQDYHHALKELAKDLPPTEDLLAEASRQDLYNAGKDHFDWTWSGDLATTKQRMLDDIASNPQALHEILAEI